MLLALSLFAVLVPYCIAQSAKKPNIIVIVSDDLGYDDLYFQSKQIETPNIDKLINTEGQFASWSYAQCVCSTSRSTLLTGRYPLHHGINGAILWTTPMGLNLSETLLPQVLHANGYATHAIGKWHLGMYRWPYTPTFRGFESFFGYYGGGENYYTHKAGNYYDFRFDVGQNCGPNCSIVYTDAYQNYSTQLFTQRAIDIVNNHSKSQPLFIYLAYQAVHAPTSAPSYYIDPYKATIADNQRRTFAGMLTCMDEGIGNLTKALQQQGYLDNNMIIVFTSDNGCPIPNSGVGDDTGCRNWPLRGGKHSVWEGGTRVVSGIWATPDLIPKQYTGQNYTNLMHISDWMPTLLDAAGINIAELGIKFDGLSHWLSISGKNRKLEIRNDVYYGLTADTSFPLNNSAYRYMNYKIFNTSGGPPYEWYPNNTSYPNSSWLSKKKNNNGAIPYELFDLMSDPFEHNEISGNQTQILEDMVLKMQQIEESGNPQTPQNESCVNNIVHPTYPVVGGVWVPWC